MSNMYRKNSKVVIESTTKSSRWLIYTRMKQWVGRVMTIKDFDQGDYIMEEDGGKWRWDDSTINHEVTKLISQRDESKNIFTSYEPYTQTVNNDDFSEGVTGWNNNVEKCHYCDDKNKDSFLYCLEYDGDKPMRMVAWVENGILISESNQITVKLPIKFCLFCGRRLQDENSRND